MSKHQGKNIEWEGIELLADARGDLDPDRLIEIGSVDDSRVILDFNIGPEPRVLFLCYELDAPRLTDPGGLSFDALVSNERERAPEGWEDD